MATAKQKARAGSAAKAKKAAKPNIPIGGIPKDYIRGGKEVGNKYTAWQTKNKKKPTFGKTGGPGTPYREITKTMPKRVSNMPDMGGWNPVKLNPPKDGQTKPTTTPVTRRLQASGRKSAFDDAKTRAISRRLGGG